MINIFKIFSAQSTFSLNNNQIVNVSECNEQAISILCTASDQLHKIIELYSVLENSNEVTAKEKEKKFPELYKSLLDSINKKCQTILDLKDDPYTEWEELTVFMINRIYKVRNSGKSIIELLNYRITLLETRYKQQIQQKTQQQQSKQFLINKEIVICNLKNILSNMEILVLANSQCYTGFYNHVNLVLNNVITQYNEIGNLNDNLLEKYKHIMNYKTEIYSSVNQVLDEQKNIINKSQINLSNTKNFQVQNQSQQQQNNNNKYK